MGLCSRAIKESLMCTPKIADLNFEAIKAIKELEKKLGNICLLAVEKNEALYVLEAKIEPNLWESIELVYPEIDNLKAYYSTEDEVRIAKGALKNYLIARKKHGIVKRPIRVRKIK
jgi:hypothetical protein